MSYILFNPDAGPPRKKTRTDLYEHNLFSLIVIARKKKQMVFTSQNLADITTNNAKISADGSVNTHYDINITGPSSGEILMFDGASWVNSPHVIADGSLNTHSDVDFANPLIGDVLTWDGNQWSNAQSASTDFTPAQASAIIANTAKVSADGSINTHNDVNVTIPSLGDILAWDGSNWINIPAIVGITPAQASAIIANTAKVSADGSINTHNDVNFTNPNPGDLISWNGSNWVNIPDNLPVLTTNPQPTDLLQYDGSNWINIPAIVGITPAQASAIIANTAKVSADLGIQTHNNVAMDNATPGQVLTWDAGNFYINKDPPTGITPQQSTDILTNNAKIGITPAQASAIIANTAKVSADGSINTHNDVQISSPNSNDLLMFDGASWVNRTPPTTYQTISTAKFLHTDTFPIGTVNFPINDLATPFYTTRANQTIIITVSIGYEKSEPGVFVLFVGGNEVGSPANANRINGIAPYLIASNMRHSCFSHVMTIASPGYYVGEVKLRYDNVISNSSINFAFNRPKTDSANSPNSSSQFSVIVL
jgi:hypothetical protein